MYTCIQGRASGWPRPTGCLIFSGCFPHKSPIISDSFAENDLQLTASFVSSPPCICVHILYVYICTCIHMYTVLRPWRIVALLRPPSYVCNTTIDRMRHVTCKRRMSHVTCTCTYRARLPSYVCGIERKTAREKCDVCPMSTHFSCAVFLSIPQT